MIRVALIAHLSEVSGAGVALLNVAAGLNPKNFEVMLVLPGQGPLLARAHSIGINAMVVSNPEKSSIAGSIASIIATSVARLTYVQKLARFLKSERIDVAYINTSASVFPGIAARRAGVPVLWHVHETLLNPDRSYRTKRYLIKRMASALLFAANAGRVAFGPTTCPVLVARNYVDVASVEASIRNAELEQKLGIHQDDFVVAMNGTAVAKGPEVLIQAAAKLKGILTDIIKLVIMGNLDDERLQSLLSCAAAQSPGFQNHIVVTGTLDSVTPILKRVDLFVSPSFSESLPITLLEAMACGAPIIATDTGDCRELLGNGERGLLTPVGDSDSLALAMDEVISDLGSANLRAKAAKAWVLENYQRTAFWTPVEELITLVAQAS